jgi:hypothetical protein
MFPMLPPGNFGSKYSLLSAIKEIMIGTTKPRNIVWTTYVGATGMLLHINRKFISCIG